MPLLQLSTLARCPDVKAFAHKELAARFHFWVAQWCLSPERVLNMMQETGCILSGSAALEMAIPGASPPNDLDFYCPCGQLEAVIRFFVETQGYRDVTEGTGECARYGDLLVGIKAVHRLELVARPCKQLNVIESTTASALAPVLFFHSSVVMNFVSAEGVMMLYPSLTSKKRGMFRT